VMAFEETPVRAPSLISFPKTEASPESITSLFRIMEWRPGRPAPAPVTSHAVPQPAAISAKVVVRPPAAPSLGRPRRIA
ncbi:DNA translocase FtsK, partial [Rhizobium ruizarguesonis]